MTPSASAKTRRFHTLSASRRAAPSSSAWVTPTRTHRPRPISPTTSPSMRTRAPVTRWTRARTVRGRERRLDLLHLRRVAAAAGGAVEPGAVQERSLGGGDVAGLALPRLERRGLERTPVRERQLPRVRAEL